MLQDRILEIVVYLVSHLNEQRGTLGNLDEMSTDLRSMGFTDNEISSAYNWLLKHFENYPDSFSVHFKNDDKGAVRVLSDIERKIISPEAYGFLIQLRHLGLISAEQMEMILDRCTLFDADPIDIGDIKILASAAMFDGGFSDMPFAFWLGDSDREPIN